MVTYRTEKYNNKEVFPVHTPHIDYHPSNKIENYMFENYVS
jgi:hypothetical protein